MQITVQNCNNIVQGEISITEGSLNIKYAINGTGKSTIAAAISAALNQDEKAIAELTPFQYLDDAENHKPSITGLDSISTVITFNENYVNQYVYQHDELIKDSFEIFVKTPYYEAHLREIEALLVEINTAFQSHPELDSLIQAFSQFIDGFGKAKSGYSKAGAIGKGLANGNKINNIPAGLEKYSPYLKKSADSTNVKWIKWQLEGKPYLDMADQCPYCSGSVADTKNTILKVADEFDVKAVEQLNKMLEVFESLTPYFAPETAIKVKEFTENAGGMTEQQKNYLLEIKMQVINLHTQLQWLKRIGFHTLRNSEKIADELKSFVIDLSLYSHLNSNLSKEKVDIINASLTAVMDKAGKLQGEVAKQNQLIQKTIEQNSAEINDFLRCAGYQYSVAIEESSDKTYRMILNHIGSNATVSAVKNHLSFGERNAFALVLFMYSALKENPDLVILDDPISSFDGNKKFAIINMLFLAKTSLKNRTVLLLTHEFNTVIDVIYTMPYNFNPNPTAAFLSIKDGVLSELPVLKSDIQSFAQIAETNMGEPIDTLNKLVYLRRLSEIEKPQSLAWQMLSNIFHKREVPLFREADGTTRDMTEEEKVEATAAIRTRLPEFDYTTEYQKTQDTAAMIDLYRNSGSNYEKLQIYRVIHNGNSGNAVVKKFVNETFHIENDYLFQLNPRKYDTVPQYIIEECDKDITV
jgi:ABC-type cobalamin/Fe3+-siderophores transport system ATPase subunit